MHLKSKFSCEEHIDMVIDDFLIDYETFPILIKHNKVTSEHCSYCSKNAVYELKSNE